MRSLIYIIISLIMVAACATSCISDDITTDPSVRLTFSRDTVSFDTVFTDLGTPTARLQVFNTDKKGVVISRIRFSNPDSPFSVNVDGVSGTEFSDVEIRGRDSIFVFIECFIPETDRKKPCLVEDKLLFTVNGTEQAVVVEAWGRNVVRLRNLTITEDMTMTAESPYVVFDSLRVAEGATLRIEPGAQVLFHDKASLTVEGRIEAVGAPGKMIDLRGDRLDNVLPDVGYDILAGQWRGIRIAPQSFGNRLEYVDMRSTEHGLALDSCPATDRVKLTLLNSWLHNSQGNALSAAYSKVEAYGCVFSEAAEAVVKLKGGVNDFIQCTISNYYLYSAITEPLLMLQHVVPDDLAEGPALPLMKGSFENGIIYGLGSDISPGDLTGSDVYLRNVLLKSEGADDDHFISCLWGEDPLFLTVREDYYFNYRLQEGSPAIGAGNAGFVQPLWQYDMDGLNRLLPGPGVNLGAYAGEVRDER